MHNDHVSSLLNTDLVALWLAFLGRQLCLLCSGCEYKEESQLGDLSLGVRKYALYCFNDV